MEYKVTRKIQIKNKALIFLHLDLRPVKLLDRELKMINNYLQNLSQ